ARPQVGEGGVRTVDLAALQRSRRRGGIRYRDPFNAIEQHPLAARDPRFRLLARNVISKLLKHRPSAWHPFVADELHRPAADIFIDRLERIGRGNPRRHDETRWRADLAQRDQQLWEWLIQGPAESAVVDSGELLLDRLQHQPHVVAGFPARDARDHVAGEYRLAVVELQSGPKA